MNPLALIIAAGYGYLAGNPEARKSTIEGVQRIIGWGVDALNKTGESNVPAPNQVPPATKE